MQQCLELVTLDYSYVVSISKIYIHLEGRGNLETLGMVLSEFCGS